MKVSQWAEIRRLVEVEKLSRRAVAQRLRCCFRTVAKALSMDHPPHEKRSAPRGSLLDPYKPKIDALLTRYPQLSAARVLEEIRRGPDGYGGKLTLVRIYLRKVRPRRGRVYQEVEYEPGQAMQIDWGHCGQIGNGEHSAKGVRVCRRAVLQPTVLYRIHFVAAEGGILPRDRECVDILWRQSAADHLR